MLSARKRCGERRGKGRVSPTGQVVIVEGFYKAVAPTAHALSMLVYNKFFGGYIITGENSDEVYARSRDI